MYHNNTDYYIFELVQSSKDIQFVKNKMNKFNDNILNIINNTDINIYKKKFKKTIRIT